MKEGTVTLDKVAESQVLRVFTKALVFDCLNEEDILPNEANANELPNELLDEMRFQKDPSGAESEDKEDERIVTL
jgi:hypothetical protein